MLRYLITAAFIIVIAVPALLGLRRWSSGSAIGIGWGLLVALTIGVAEFAYLHPQFFGMTAAEVRSPDAPDVIPTAIVALVVAFASYTVGVVASLFFPPVRR